MNFTPEPNPKIRALAKETSRKIKALSNTHQDQLEALYREFRSQADALREEGSADRLEPSSATLPTSTIDQQSQGH